MRVAGGAALPSSSGPSSRESLPLQVLSVLDVLTGRDGTTRGQEKVDRLCSNSNLMRRGLIEAGLGVLGSWDSPVMVCAPV